MQLRLQPKYKKTFVPKSFLIKTILFILVIFLAVFLLDKIEMPVPTKLIKQEISNDKLITVK